MTDISVSPVRSDPLLDGDHERMAHIVLEGFKPDDGDFVSTGPTVVEGLVNGTAVKALCGKVWVPGPRPQEVPLVPDVQGDRRGSGLAPPERVTRRRRAGSLHANRLTPRAAGTGPRWR